MEHGRNEQPDPSVSSQKGDHANLFEVLQVTALNVGSIFVESH